MNPGFATSKGANTRDRLVERATELARSDGLEGLTIGSVASAAHMSKSGVFAHFGSREDLQLAVLDHAADGFVEAVIRPALRERRGLPRLRAIMERWTGFVERFGDHGGCILIAAASEFDDRPGAVRERVLEHQRRLRQEMTRCAAMAVECGDLRADTDPAQLAFETYALVLVTHHDLRLFGADEVLDRARRGFESLLSRYLP